MRRLRDKHLGSAWLGVLWGLALLGLLLLPSDYRAGGEMSHGHSLIQIWIDAADGHIHHHHDSAAPNRSVIQDWLDPAVGISNSTGAVPTTPGDLDVGAHQDSTPAPGGIHLLPVSLAFLLVIVSTRQHGTERIHTPAGRSPKVLLPPPRWTIAAS